MKEGAGRRGRGEKRQMKREDRGKKAETQVRENEGLPLLLGFIPSTAGPHPKLSRSSWIFTVVEAAQTFPHPTLLPELR